jgi:hypothetical protein
MMPMQRWIVGLCLVGALALVGCNLPVADSKTDAEKLVQTAAAQTVSAIPGMLTATALSGGTSAVTASATPEPSLTPPPTVVPSATPVPPSATVALPCNSVTFVTDVTVPDGSKYAPGATFTKTWRLKNTGTCAWTTAYKLVFDSGTQMDGPSPAALPANVNPGGTIDLSVTLKAPAAAGKYKSYWVLENASGTRFGLSGGGSFWADIEVVANTATNTPTITLTPSITPTFTQTFTPTITSTP